MIAIEIHLLHGKEENYHGLKTKSGCGLRANDIKIKQYVYWNNRGKVNCLSCLEKIEKMERLNEKN